MPDPLKLSCNWHEERFVQKRLSSSESNWCLDSWKNVLGIWLTQCILRPYIDTSLENLYVFYTFSVEIHTGDLSKSVWWQDTSYSTINSASFTSCWRSLWLNTKCKYLGLISLSSSYSKCVWFLGFLDCIVCIFLVTWVKFSQS